MDRTDDLLVIRDEMFAEMVELASSGSLEPGEEEPGAQDRYTLLHDALRQCIDLEELAALVGMDFYTRDPAPKRTDDLYWVDLTERSSIEIALGYLLAEYKVFPDAMAPITSAIKCILTAHGAAK